jgi:protein-tyrosine phosphatase
MKQVLFICTGNYYRSRFAEALFNHAACSENLPWRAFSRGLAIHLVNDALSPHTIAALEKLGIDRSHTAPDRQSLREHDLQRTDLAIAMDNIEHRPLMLQQFPDWADRIRYWQRRDLQWESSTTCLPGIREDVQELLATVRSSNQK